MITTAWKYAKTGLAILLFVAILIGVELGGGVSAVESSADLDKDGSFLYEDPLYGYRPLLFFSSAKSTESAKTVWQSPGWGDAIVILADRPNTVYGGELLPEEPLQAAIMAIKNSRPDMSPGTKIAILDARIESGWGYAYYALYDPQTDSYIDIEPQAVLLQVGADGVWRGLLRVPDRAVFNHWLLEIPDSLIGNSMKEFLRQGERSPISISGHRLPWPAGQAGYSSNQHGYAALDFDILGSPSLGTVVASKGGTVVFAKDLSQTGCQPGACDWQYANIVVIQHSASEYSWYLHLDHNSVPGEVYVGASIEQGDEVGTEDTTGWATGPHLHFMVTSDFACCTGSGDLYSPYWPSQFLTVNFDEYSWDELNCWNYCGPFYSQNDGGSSPPATPSNLNANTVDHDSIDLDWNDNSDNEDGFKIYRNGTHIATVGANVESYTNNGLSCNTTYSYYVKAYNENGDSGASNTDSATTNSCSPPPTPSLVSPPNGVSFTSCSSITLDWNASSGADDYDVEYWGASSGSNNTSQTNWNIGIRPPGSYSWHVRANNEWGSSSWSSTWTFTVNGNVIPSAPTLLSPPDNGWINSHDIPLSWQAANDDGCPNSLSYTVEIGSDTYSGIGGTTYTAHVNNDADYVWRARAYDGQDYGPWSSARTVKVDATPPDTSILTGPQGDIPNNTATFTWTGNDNRTSVSELQYAYRLTGPGQPGNWSGYSNSTSTSFSNLDDGAFVFEVRARDLAGNVDGTPDARSFYVDTTPPETTILSGPDNPTGDTNPIFVWTGSDARTPPEQLEYSSRLTNTTGFDTDWSAWSLDTTREFIGLTDGLYTFWVYARDGVGNEDASPSNWTFHLDTIPPTGTLLINNGASQTTSVVVLLDITGDDGPDGTGVSEMRLSSDGIHWDTWQPFTEFTTWELPDVNRATWTVHLELKDFVGNVSSVITDDIYLNFYPNRPASESFQLGARGYLPGGSSSISGVYSLPSSAIGETIAGSGSTSNFYQMAGGYVPSALAQPNGPYLYEVFDMWQQVLSAMGGAGSTTNYQMFSVGGEGPIGGHASASANYSLHSGFWLGDITPSAPIFYDDADYGIQYDGWRGGLDATAYGGGYRAASANSQRIVYKSQQPATSVTVVVCRGPNLGYAYILIPGQYQSPIDLYAPQAACDQAVTISGLAPLAHTIVFMATGQKNPASSGTEVRVDAFEVNGTRIDDNDPKVIYHSWSAITAPWTLGGSTRLTTQPQAMVRFTFEGDAFTWKTITCPGCGRAAVIVDSMPAIPVDNYGPWNLNAEQSFINLGSGTHVVQIYTLATPNPASSGTLISFDGYSVP